MLVVITAASNAAAFISSHTETAQEVQPRTDLQEQRRQHAALFAVSEANSTSALTKTRGQEWTDESERCRSSCEGKHGCNCQRPAEFGRFVIAFLPRAAALRVLVFNIKILLLGLTESKVRVVTFPQRSLNAARTWNPTNKKPVLLMNLIPKQSPSALSTNVSSVTGCSKASLNLAVFLSHAIYFIAHACLCCCALTLWSWTASSSKVQMFPGEFVLNLKCNLKFQTCWI